MTSCFTDPRQTVQLVPGVFRIFPLRVAPATIAPNSELNLSLFNPRKARVLALLKPDRLLLHSSGRLDCGRKENLHKGRHDGTGHTEHSTNNIEVEVLKEAVLMIRFCVSPGSRDEDISA